MLRVNKIIGSSTGHMIENTGHMTENTGHMTENHMNTIRLHNTGHMTMTTLVTRLQLHTGIHPAILSKVVIQTTLTHYPVRICVKRG